VETVTKTLENVFARTNGTAEHAQNILQKPMEQITTETKNAQFAHTRKPNVVDQPAETVTNKMDNVLARMAGLVLLALLKNPPELPGTNHLLLLPQQTKDT